MKIDGKTSHNSPSLRFPEFNGEWKNTTLEECVDFLDGQRKPIKSDDRKGEKRLYPYYGASGIIDYIDEYIFDGDYILLSEDGANIIDRNYRVAFIANGKIWVNNHAHVLQPHKEMNINFLSEALERINYAIYNTGTTMPKLNQEICRKINLNVPSLSEQNKIGNLLYLLNERIATQNRLIEDLKKLKSAISKELFSNHLMFDKKVPLSDFCSMKNGYAFKSSSYEVDGIYNIVTIANVTGDRYISSDCNKVANMPNDIQIHQHLCVNDILVSLTGNVGRVSLCREGYYLLNQRVGLLDVSKTICKEFIYQILSTKHFENEMIAKAQGAAQMNISKSDVESYLIPYTTNLNVINKVASLLNAYDSQILMGEQLLLDLTRQKQYMLRQMFI